MGPSVGLSLLHALKIPWAQARAATLFVSLDLPSFSRGVRARLHCRDAPGLGGASERGRRRQPLLRVRRLCARGCDGGGAIGCWSREVSSDEGEEGHEAAADKAGGSAAVADADADTLNLTLEPWPRVVGTWVGGL